MTSRSGIYVVATSNSHHCRHSPAHFTMKAFVLLCALAAFTSATDDHGKRGLLRGLGLDFNSGYTGYGSGRRSHGNSYGYGYDAQNYGAGIARSGYGNDGYYSDNTPVAIPYNSYPPAGYAGYPSSSYAAAASYSAPATKVVAVSKVVNVQREVTIPQVVHVRKVITEPKVITVKQVLPSPGYTGYGTGVSGGFAESGYSGAYAGGSPSSYSNGSPGSYSSEYPNDYSGSMGSGTNEGWW